MDGDSLILSSISIGGRKKKGKVSAIPVFITQLGIYNRRLELDV